MYEPGNQTDEQIVEVVRTTDKEQFVLLIRRYQKKLLRYALYLVSDADMAADAVQEAFMKAFVNLRGFDTRQKFSSWIYRIVHNEAMNLIRKNRIVISAEDVYEEEADVHLEDELIKRELIQRTHHCLQQMSLLYREPLSLYFIEEKSYEEISDILRIPVATVGTRINRAKKIIKKLCQKKN